jgi:hypothetical protein
VTYLHYAGHPLPRGDVTVDTAVTVQLWTALAALAILILVPFGLLFNNVTLGFTCHLSYLHTDIQLNNADCRRVTFAQNLKIASALTYGILPRRLQVHTIT